VDQVSTRLREVLVPVDGSEASIEAVALACSVAKRSKGKVYVVYVIEVPRSLPLDADLSPEVAKGEEVLDLADRRARIEDFQVKSELLQARDAGHAIVDEAIERNVDGIVLAVPSPRRAAGEGGFAWPRGGKPSPSHPPGEFKLGHVAQYVLENAPCQVWLIRLAHGSVA
jgi:nucleotide-binding universal stress UspA family protein